MTDPLTPLDAEEIAQLKARYGPVVAATLRAEAVPRTYMVNILRLLATVTQARKERDEALRSKEALIRKVKRLEDRCAVLSGALEPHDLRTQAEQARRERDDADAVIQRLDGGWMPDDSCDGPTWYLESGIDDDPDEFDGIEPMTPGEVDAIRRARAVPGGDGE